MAQPHRTEVDPRQEKVDLRCEGPGKRGSEGERPRPPVTGEQDHRRTHRQAEHDANDEFPSLPFSRYLGVEVGHDGEEHRSYREGDEAPGPHATIIGYSPNVGERGILRTSSVLDSRKFAKNVAVNDFLWL